MIASKARRKHGAVERIVGPGTEVRRRPLWPHQREAIALCVARRSVMLDAWMGSGKSRVIVELLDKDVAAGRACRPLVVIVAPKSVVENGDAWRREFKRYTRGTVRFLALHHGTVAKRVQQAEDGWRAAQLSGEPLVVVLNYETLLRGLGDWLLSAAPYMIVFDEVHRLRGEKGKTSKRAAALTKLKCGVSFVTSRVVGLTGTPMTHSPLDLWAQYRALDPTVLGTNFWSFKQRYARMEQKFFGGRRVHHVIGYQNIDELSKRVAAMTYRVPRDVVLAGLPPIAHERVLVKLEPKARRLYDAMLRDCCVELPGGGEITTENALTVGCRLRQITSGFASADDNADNEIVSEAKLDALVDILDAAGDEPVVVFGVMHCELDLLRRAADKLGHTVGELRGGKNELAEWQRGETQHLAVQITAGGVGVDMTRARIGVVINPGWVSGDYDQFKARLHRPGQTRSTMFYHLVVPDTVDEVVYNSLHNQQNVVRAFTRYLKEAQAEIGQKV